MQVYVNRLFHSVYSIGDTVKFECVHVYNAMVSTW